MNILVNAIEAIEDQGTITVKTSCDSTTIYIQIADTGKGISPKHINNIYNPGFTTKGSGVGTGLGLSTCYSIMNKHQGDIDVKSETGKGTIFTISIPILST